MRTQVFISYRRDGGLDAAKHIHGLLQDTYEVFFDKESLRSGRFDINIENAIKDCTDFLLILSENIFARYEEEGDWISRETRLALDQGKNVIPIFLDGFTMPETANKTIETLLNHNGIGLSEEGFGDRLKSFLKSNIRCDLTLDGTKEGYCLTTEAIEVLKEIYRNTVKNREFAVQVRLIFPDIDETCEMLASRLILEAERKMYFNGKKQRVLGKQQSYRNSIERAIEFMITDEVNVSIPAVAYALRDRALCGEYYTDVMGKLHSYATVCVWQAIIEELLKEFTVDAPNRLSDYRSRRAEYEAIDCVIDHLSRKDRRGWYFITHAPKEEITHDVAWYQFMKESPIKLSGEALVSTVLPDFYHKVAETLLYCDDERLKEELLDPDADIRYLGNYWFGLS